MLLTDKSLNLALSEFSYGSLWLIGAADGDPHHLSPFAVHALSTADAVIHDPGISPAILDLVKLSHYREVAAPQRAIERAIQLTRDGWRVVYLVEGNTAQRSVEYAMRCAERNVAVRIMTDGGEPVGNEAPLGFVLVRKALAGDANPHATLVVLVTTPGSDAAEAVTRQRPLDFSMSGLAG
jgi:uroporphyrin-III C-methyltransferase